MTTHPTQKAHRTYNPRYASRDYRQARDAFIRVARRASIDEDLVAQAQELLEELDVQAESTMEMQDFLNLKKRFVENGFSIDDIPAQRRDIQVDDAGCYLVKGGDPRIDLGTRD